jgi:hypothetical protein
MMVIKKYAVPFILVLMLFNCGGVKEDSSGNIKRLPPVDISLSYIPGAKGDKAVLILSVYNGIAQDAALRKAGDKVQSVLTLEERLLPYKLKMEKGDWLSKIAFMYRAGSLNDGLTVVEAGAKEMVLDKTSVYRIIYVLNATHVPEDGSKIQAQWNAGDIKANSNHAAIPPLAPTDFENKTRQANVASFLKEADTLLAVSQELINLDSSNTIGYWFQARAYEIKKDYKKALQSLEIAMSKVRSVKGVHSEPPVKLIRKMQEISQKL